MPTEFIVHPDVQISLLAAHQHAMVVVLSLLIAMLSGVLVVYLVKVARTVTDVWHQDVAHGGGVLVLGCGLWCGQFLGLLASDYGISVTYDAGWMAGSMLMAVCVAWLMMDQFVRPVAMAALLPTEMLAGLLATAGIAAMQYMAASSMQMLATLQFDGWRLGICLIVTMASCVWLLRRQYAPPAIFSQLIPHEVSHDVWRQVTAGALAGLVFVSNDYLGVSAIRLSGVAEADYQPASLHTALETAIGALLLFVLVIMAHATLMYRRMSHIFDEGQERMKLLMSSSSEGLFILNQEYVIVSANRAAARMFSRESSELTGCSVNILMSEFSEAFQSGNHEAFAVPGVLMTSTKLPETRELLAHDKQGKIFPVKVSLTRAGKDMVTEPCIVLAIHDLSAEREALRRERDAKSETLSVISALTEHTILSETDSSGTIIRVNDAFVAVSGYRKSELIGQPHSIVGTDVYPQALWEGMWQSLRRGKSWRHELCNRTPAGEAYWLDTIIIPVMDEQSHLRRIIGVHQDITAQKNRLATQRLRQGFAASLQSTSSDIPVVPRQMTDSEIENTVATQDPMNTTHLAVLHANG
ncbi:PAS domain S-box protein [Undibacterium sp. SXout7W]|uniref:PAS domain S-box protein n=1 Tax=Undibacterium sp. SXout7W TaxID=3413049 RepID=UPI003BF37892